MAKYFWHPNAKKWLPQPPRSPRPRIHVISDTMDPIKSMASGLMHDSKSTYYKEVKAKGYEIVGDDDNFASDVSFDDP